jgi:molybdenum cofactor cytidylyltransferase
MSVAAIILAAGASRRLGQPKQLLLYKGETLLERAIRLAGEAGALPVIVVLGAHYSEIRAAVSFGNAMGVVNEDWEQGIASSIHAGLDVLDSILPEAPGALLMTCDQPRLGEAHLRALIGGFSAQSSPAIVASKYAGTLGVPAVFPRSIFPELRGLRGDQGARALLSKATLPVLAIGFPGGEVDIDSAADLAQLE